MDLDENLAELLSFVRRDGRFKWHGGSITSHPQYAGDLNQQRIHADMIELERKGLVYRHYVDEKHGSVTWLPVADNN